MQRASSASRSSHFLRWGLFIRKPATSRLRGFLFASSFVPIVLKFRLRAVRSPNASARPLAGRDEWKFNRRIL